MTIAEAAAGLSAAERDVLVALLPGGPDPGPDRPADRRLADAGVADPAPGAAATRHLARDDRTRVPGARWAVARSACPCVDAADDARSPQVGSCSVSGRPTAAVDSMIPILALHGEFDLTRSRGVRVRRRVRRIRSLCARAGSPRPFVPGLVGPWGDDRPRTAAHRRRDGHSCSQAQRRGPQLSG